MPAGLREPAGRASTRADPRVQRGRFPGDRPRAGVPAMPGEAVAVAAVRTMGLESRYGPSVASTSSSSSGASRASTLVTRS